MFRELFIILLDQSHSNINENYCSMKVVGENFKISYRDNENLSHSSDIDLDSIFKF